jgi:hypothetical protein
MARRFIFAVVAIAAAAMLLPVGVHAATAPVAAPALTSTAFTLPVTFRWTPGNDFLNTSQAVFRNAGACTTPVSGGAQVATYPGNATTQYTSAGTTLADGVYCFYIQTTDSLAATDDSPGLTVTIDTNPPTAAVSVSGQVAGVVSGTVTVTGTGADAASGVASGVLHAGAAGACPAGVAIPASWDTKLFPNGVYDVCNVVTDNAGHVTVATVRVTVANALPPPAAPPPPPAGTVAGGATVDTVAPKAPTKLSVVTPRAKVPTGKIAVMLRWVKPTAADLDRVVVVLNLKRAPRNPVDGGRVYSGLGTAVGLKLRADQTGYVALYAYDASGNVSKAARKVISLASLIPLRPLTGSVVSTTTPVLTWKPKQGSAYYNVQIYRNGKRMLVGWPTKASFLVPTGKLLPGTYVWFVWPALKEDGDAPTYADLIGRATFVVKL